MSRTLYIKIAQHNMCRAGHVTDELRLQIAAQSIEVLLLQEPYATKTSLKHLEVKLKFLHQTG